MGEPRILLIRPDHLGDVLFTLPAAMALRRSVPSARLTYLVATGLEPVPNRCPAVDETLVLPFPPPHAPEGSGGTVTDSAASTLRERFDIAVVLRPHDPWSGSLVRLAGIPVRVGFATGGMDRFLTETVQETRNRHAVLLAHDVMTMAFHRLNGSTPKGSPPPTPSPADRPFVPSEADEKDADDAMARLREVTGTRPLIVHPGTGWTLKNWSPARWGELAFELHRRFETRPVVTGGHGEEELVQKVVAQSAGAAVSLSPPLGLGAFAALLSRAAMVVASDSGPLHLAAMVGAPVIGLFGPGSPALATPWCPPERRRIVRVDLPCSPCGVMHDPPCGATSEPACVTKVNVESVLRAIESLGPRVP
ncbi:MAG: glycosyltransferase family 9 protein [Actinomycetota bacterium]|nr:glycosyltransferase family 9 protein [Actinomycetota bacterium]